MNGLRRWSRPRIGRLGLVRPGARRQRGQALLELAVFLLLILIFGPACMQFAVIFIAYMNVVQVTRDATRWVAVHPYVIDSATESTIRGRLPSGISSGALTLTFTPPCTALSSGKCTARTSGSQISVRSRYTITSHLSVPSSLGWGTLTVAIPTTLPDYEVFMQVEPS